MESGYGGGSRVGRVTRAAWIAAAALFGGCASPIVPLPERFTALVTVPAASEGEAPMRELRELPAPGADGLLLPMVRSPEGSLVGWLDLRYGTNADDPAEQTLDLIAPATVVGDGTTPPTRGLPIALFVHGGGWARGEKRGFLERRAPAFGRVGCILATMNYRLAPAAQHPAQVRDAAAAVAWLKANARAFGGDPDALFVMGHSAGAQIAALAAVDERWLGEQKLGLDALRGAIMIDGGAYDVLARSDDRADAVAVLTQAFGDDRDAWADASPLRHVAPGKKIAPCLLLRAGRNPDSEEPTRLFSEALVGAGVITQVTHFPNKNHVSISRDLGLPGDGPTWRILDFIAEQTGRPRPPRPPAPVNPPPVELQPVEGEKDGEKSDGAKSDDGGATRDSGAR